jgi:hypothetical protein
MAQVITFENYVPTPRYDSIPWTEVDIEEGLTETGSFTVIDNMPLSPVDSDPANPAARSFTTELADDAMDLWYRLVFRDASGDETVPTDAIQNTADINTYATVHELQRILKIRTPTTEQRAAMRRVLITATGEIDAEVDLAADATALAGWQLHLTNEVCLERAVEHWRQMESPFGLVGLGPEMPAERVARDSWDRHAHKLAPLKNQWGLA